MVGNDSQRFRPNWLLWDIERPSRKFRIYVVEPRTVDPANHASIFQAAIQAFLPQSRLELGAASATRVLPPRDRFDLLTFPEAFLPSASLVQLFSWLDNASLGLGCIHVGLRPTNQPEETNHLFAVSELTKLVEQLKALDSVVSDDLTAFKRWLDEQNTSERFNIGCLFTIDPQQRIRVCLHAKLVRSKFEVHPRHDHNMAEANLLSLVTLRPTNPELSSITIQPLICSDVLGTGTDVPNNNPIPAVTNYRSCFEQRFSDEVDVVSVATMTPNGQLPDGTLFWHQEFRESFVRAASDDGCRRHHRAAFVLSNFHFTRAPGEAPGGLSGAFIPLPMYRLPHEEYVAKSKCVYGHFPIEHHEHDKNRWISRDATWDAHAREPVLGYILGLEPAAMRDRSVGTMFGFTLITLPRDANLWARSSIASDFALYDATGGEDIGEVQFTRRGGA